MYGMATAVAVMSLVGWLAWPLTNTGRITGTAFPLAAVRDATTWQATGVPVPATKLSVDVFQYPHVTCTVGEMWNPLSTGLPAASPAADAWAEARPFRM